VLLAGVWFGFESVAQWLPRAHAYAAAVYTVLGFNAFFAVVAIVMAAYVVARQIAGHIDRQRRVSFDNARIFWHYTVAQSVAGLLLLYGFPRLVH